MTYYFSTTGNDNNNGTSEKTPWKSLSKINTLTAGVAVMLKRGNVWELSETLFIEKAVIIDAYGTGPLPVISGMARIGNWKSIGGNLWEGVGDGEVLTYNGVNMPLGSSVRDGWSTDPAVASSLGTAEIYARTNRYSISQLGTSFTPGYGFRMVNRKDFLTRNGDWMTKGTKLTIYSDRNPINDIIRNSVMEQTVYLKAEASGISISNLTFEGGDNLCLHNQASNCLITSCLLRNSGSTGFFSDGNAQNVTITFCELKGFPVAGIFLVENNDCMVFKNTVSEIALRPGGNQDLGGRAAINAIGNGNTISNNTISFVGLLGISAQGNGVSVIKNYVSNFCNLLDDGGGIYLSRINGAVISNNEIYNVSESSAQGTDSQNYFPSYSIYLDDGCDGVEVSYNVGEDAGDAVMFVHNSKNINIHDNIFGNGRTRQVFVYYDNPTFFKPENIRLSDNTLKVRKYQKAIDVSSVIANNPISIIEVGTKIIKY